MLKYGVLCVPELDVIEFCMIFTPGFMSSISHTVSSICFGYNHSVSLSGLQSRDGIMQSSKHKEISRVDLVMTID